MTSFGACGDVVRNIVSCPGLQAERGDEPPRATSPTTSPGASSPTTSAHWEIFVNGDRAASTEVEPPSTTSTATPTCPRKFKIAIAHPGDNCVDVFAQDLGLVPVVAPRARRRLHGARRRRSRSQLRQRRHLLSAGRSIDLRHLRRGRRRDRRGRRHLPGPRGPHRPQARPDEVRRRRPRPRRVPARRSRHALARDTSGRRCGPAGHRRRRPPRVAHARPTAATQLGIRVGAGRVRDVEEPAPGCARRCASHRLERLAVTFLVTPQQDILIAGDRRRGPTHEVGEILRDHGVRLRRRPRCRSSATPGLPGPAHLRPGADRGRAPAARPRRAARGRARAASLGGRRLQLRMTGCPNGCARPAVAEVGVVGRTKTTYDVFVGGGPRGDRLASSTREKVKFERHPRRARPRCSTAGRPRRRKERRGLR